MIDLCFCCVDDIVCNICLGCGCDDLMVVGLFDLGDGLMGVYLFVICFYVFGVDLY